MLGLFTVQAMAANSFTPHYNFTLPQDGDTNWGSGYRANFTALDADLFSTASTLTAHVNATSSAHPATAISATGGSVCLTPLNVQAYLLCLDSAVNTIVGGGAASISGNNTFTGTNIFSGPFTASSSVTLSSLGLGVVHSSVGGGISSSPVLLGSEVSGTLPVLNGGTGLTAPGSSGNLLTSNGTSWVSSPSATSGTVTSVSVASANGLAGTVATSTTTPAITLSTTVTGILSGNGMAISAASSTGSGSVVLATSPTLVTPILGTPTSGVATNLTGLPLTTGVTGTLGIGNGGTGQVTKAAAFDALQPMTTGGDLIYGGASGTGTRLANGSSGQVLQSAGGTAAPTWSSAIGPVSGIAIVGTNTNNAAAIGQVGELVQASQTAFTNYPTAGNYGDLTSISLTAGDWDIYCDSNSTASGSTYTGIRIGFSTTTGNSATGLTQGTTLSLNGIVSNSDGAIFLMGTLQLASTTTVYLKYRATYSAGTPQAVGSIIARRRR